MKFGHDFLAINHYYRTAVLAARPGEVAGMFLTTFGNARPTLERMAKSKKFCVIVVHLAPFDRTHRYPISRLKKQVLADTRFCAALAKRTGQDIWISAFCEHQHAAKDMRPLFIEMRKIAPNCTLVNSIYKGGQEVDGTITEIHVEKSSALPKVPKNQFIVSFDGCGSTGTGDMPDLNIDAIVQRYSAALHIRAWNFRYNGKFGHKDTTDISKRKCWPNVKYIRGTRALLDAREGGLTWGNGRLAKPFADDHGDPEPTKDNRFMVILPKVDKDSVRVFDSKGNHIDTLRRFRPDHSGDPMGPRYYSSRYAFEIANLAHKNTGSYLGKVENSPLFDLRKRSSRFK
jgi:hypothetical protein